GAPPEVGACTDFGFDAGGLGCGQFCTPAFAACRHFGWRPETDAAVVLDVWGTAADDVWALAFSFDGDALHFDGAGWSLTTIDAVAVETAIWGRAADDFFAVGRVAGSGVIFHYDGEEWS